MKIKIRRMNDSDAESLYSLLSDPEVMRFLEPPYSKEQTDRFLVEAGLSEKPLIYAVEKDEHFIGYVIFHDYDEESMEIGWVLNPSCWGLGIASILTTQLLEETKHMGKHAVIECVPEQKSTIRIAEKFGFQNTSIDEGLLIFRKQHEIPVCEL